MTLHPTAICTRVSLTSQTQPCAKAESHVHGQVSVSGQALVFVVRTLKWSLAERAGGFIYLAFGIAQVNTSHYHYNALCLL